ncbi:hypothetical protein HY251_21185, partial [bacterium]|nr:hypothetical protein [bacterium]
DASFGRDAHANGNGSGPANGNGSGGKEKAPRADLVRLAKAPPPVLPRGRFVADEETESPVTAIGRSIDEAHDEFSGVLGLSSRGVERTRKAFEQARARGLEARFHEAAAFRSAALTDLVAELVASGADVRGVLHWKGWMEVDTFDDYRRAWATTAS